MDEVHRRPKRVVPIDLNGGIPEEQARAGDGSGDRGRYLTREEFERALIVAMRLLLRPSGRSLILREALGFSARETAVRLDTSVAAAGSVACSAPARGWRRWMIA